MKKRAKNNEKVKWKWVSQNYVAITKVAVAPHWTKKSVFTKKMKHDLVS
jgi:hypothetical protein